MNNEFALLQAMIDQQDKLIESLENSLEVKEKLLENQFQIIKHLNAKLAVPPHNLIRV